jgi:predicted dehydrogenase
LSPALRAVVVGCGRIGARYDAGRGGPPLSHAGAYAAHQHVELVAGVDPDPAARQAFEAAWGAPCHETLGPALEGAELVSVCTGPEGRERLMAEVLEARPRAIWSEKPFAADAAAGERVAQACHAAGVPVQVNYLRRFDPAHRVVHDAVAGRVTHADFRYSGSLEMYGTHALDLFRWFVGEAASVRALDTGGRPLVVASTADGRTGTFMRVERGDATDVFDAVMYAGSDRVTLSAVGEDVVLSEATESDVFPGVTSHRAGEPSAEGGMARAMEAGAEDLVRCARDGSPLSCTAADGVAALRLFEAARRAHETGAPVSP